MNDQARGRQTVEQLTNKSGGGVVAGDVVIVDTTNNTAFTTTTSAQITVPVGVALETIASNATGRVLTHGYAPLINVPASVTRGYYIETHTIAKQAVGNATRRDGSFGIFLIGGTTPTAWIWGAPDAAAGGFTTNDIHEVELSRTTLGAAGNFDISGISGSYDHLILRAQLRGDVAATNDNVVMFFNNDTTEGNYLRAVAYWGSTSGSGLATTMFACPAGNSQANDFGQVEIHIYNYADTSQTKNYMARSSMRWDATTFYLYINHGNWGNTAAITRITLQPDGYATNKFAIGSFLQIVGVKTEA